MAVHNRDEELVSDESGRPRTAPNAPCSDPSLLYMLPQVLFPPYVTFKAGVWGKERTNPVENPLGRSALVLRFWVILDQFGPHVR